MAQELDIKLTQLKQTLQNLQITLKNLSPNIKISKRD